MAYEVASDVTLSQTRSDTLPLHCGSARQTGQDESDCVQAQAAQAAQSTPAAPLFQRSLMSNSSLCSVMSEHLAAGAPGPGGWVMFTCSCAASSRMAGGELAAERLGTPLADRRRAA